MKKALLPYFELGLLRHVRPPIRRAFLAMTGCLFLVAGCTGSGAVNPLTPANNSKTDASAVSDSDVIYWTSFPVTFSMTDPLNGVWIVSKKTGWACGNNGAVLKWDGDTWEKVDTGLAKNENLMAVAFADENEGWMVGTHGTILHYQNGSWKLDDSQTQETLYTLAVTPSRTVWVGGSNGTLLSYNGVSWGKITSAYTSTGSAVTISDDIYGMSFSGQNNGWAVGNRGLLLSWDGQKWQQYPTTPTTERLNSVSVINEVQAWAVGAFGTILRFNGTAWNKEINAFSGFDFYQVHMKNDGDGWAVGQDGTIIFYDGSRWISHQKPEGKPSLNSVAFYKDMGFIVGQNGAILKFQPNGEMAKFSFLFKGVVEKEPSKKNPYWTVTYTVMNQSPKASPLVTFELPIPKGLEPIQPKPTPSPTPGGSLLSASPTTTPPTATPTSTPTKVVGTPAATPQTSTPTPPAASAVSGAWKMKDNNLEWEIGNISSAEIKTLTFQLQNKKDEKKDYPVLLKAVLKSVDKVMAEAAPVTLAVSEPKAESPPATLKPSSNPTPASMGATPTKDAD